MGDERYVVAKAACRGGVTLALFVGPAKTAGRVLIRRLVGQSFRLGRPRAAKEVEVDAGDVVRDATRRELALGFVL